MTVELRSRRAAQAIHAAVARVEPPPLRVRKRLLLRRAFLAVFLVGVTPPVGVAVVHAVRNDTTTAGLTIKDVPRHSLKIVEPTPTARARRGRTTEITAGEVPSRAAAGEDSFDETAPLWPHCVPLIKDPKGDIDNPAVDILESSITYDAAKNTLTATHTMDDIASRHLPTEQLGYELYFKLGTDGYSADVYVTPTGETDYMVKHQTGNPTTNGTETMMAATGSIDREADTVTIVIDLGEFNRARRSEAQSAGLPRPTDLGKGSYLSSIELVAYPRLAGPGPYDQAGGCNYVVE